VTVERQPTIAPYGPDTVLSKGDVITVEYKGTKYIFKDIADLLSRRAEVPFHVTEIEAYPGYPQIAVGAMP